MSLFSELKNRNVLRVAAAYVVSAWLLIQVVETIFPAFGFGPGAVRLVVIISAIGFVPVLVFSWLFEVTPSGIRRESEIDRSRPDAAGAASSLNRAIIVILTLATGFFAFDKFVLDPARDAELEKTTTERVRTEALVESYGDSSIAVLPFRNMSDDPGNEYFSDGISEELLNLLARIPRLRVISRSSSFSFKGKDVSVPEVAERLKVAFVLEGSVRKSGENVRITAQLIEARSDTHLWSETYDRSLDDVFAIQDEISAAIVAALKGQLRLGTDEAPKVTSTGSPEAHDAELRGRFLLAQRVPGARGRAAAEFEKALTLDPGFAMAHAGLGLALAFAGCDDVSETQCEARIEHHIDTALTLEPGLAEAHAANAFWSLSRGRLEDAREHSRRALDINPNYAAVYVWMAGVLSSPREALEANEKALMLDPLSPLTNRAYIKALMKMGQLDEAGRRIEEYAAIDPLSAIFLRGKLSAVGGKTSELILAALETLSVGGGALNYRWAVFDELVLALAEIGLDQEALRMEGSEQAFILSWFGDPEAAVALARSQYSEHTEDPWYEFQFELALAHAGHYAEVRPYLVAGWRDHRGYALAFGLDRNNMFFVQALIGVLRSTGDEAEANRVLMEFTDYLHAHREADIVSADLDYLQGVAAWLAGERDRGLALMSRGVTHGYWILPPAPFQQSMYQDPGFAPLLEQQRVRQARERKKVLAFACADDYPYAAAWRPSEETCRQFLNAASN